MLFLWGGVLRLSRSYSKFCQQGVILLVTLWFIDFKSKIRSIYLTAFCLAMSWKRNYCFKYEIWHFWFAIEKMINRIKSRPNYSKQICTENQRMLIKDIWKNFVSLFLCVVSSYVLLVFTHLHFFFNFKI